MSKVFNMVGGGGGGPYASIFVTGLSETDTVTAVHKKTVQVPNPAAHGLPDGYIELEYIESTGTQYIQVPAPTVTNGFIVEFSFYSGSQPSGYYPLFVSLGYSGFWLGWLNGSFIVRMADNKDVITTSFTTNKWIDAKVVYDGSTVKLFFDGNQVGSATATFANGGVNTYFCYDTANKTSFRLGNFEFSVGGTAIYHYVPCKNGSNSVGLYDIVTETFYGNSGTGTFIAGAEIPAYIETTVEDKTLTGKWMQKLNPVLHGLPDGYTELEYIESSGTQYIDLGFIPNLQMTVDVDAQFTALPSSSEYQMGSRDSNSAGKARYFNIIVPYNLDNFNFGLGRGEIPSSVSKDTKRHTFTLDAYNKRFGVDENYTTVDELSELPTVSFYVFARNTRGTAEYFSYMRVYGVKVYENGVLTRQYVPCENNSDALGLYDIVNNVFYTNAGTGVFTAGAEVPQIIGGHIIQPIHYFGTWTVTATDGVQTATQDVLVDVITEYEIEMLYSKLYLYRDGDMCEDATGGWTITKTGDFYGYPFTGTVTFNADNIYIATLDGGGDERQLPFANTVNTIDLTGYSTLKIEYENATVGYYESNRMSRIYIASAVGVASMQGYFEKSLSFSGSGISELDITSLSGGKYVVLTTAADIEIYATIKKVWLE